MKLLTLFPWAMTFVALVWSRETEKKYKLKHDEKRFPLWVMKIKLSSVVSCAATCKIHKMCSYYSYNDDAKLCLIHSNREEDSILISDSKWRIYQPVNTDCPAHWDWFDGNCYFFSQDEKSWHDAKANCVEQQSMLAEVISENENNFLKEKAEEHAASHWIGATDIETEGFWIWDTTQTVVTFTDWLGRPDNHNGNQDCVQLRRAIEFKWDDNYCTALRAFICQKPAFP